MTEALSARGSPRVLLLRLLPWGLYALAALGAALWLRYGLIENTPIGLSCNEGVTAPWYCGPRLWLVRFNLASGWSFAALIGAGLALAAPTRALLVTGLALGLGAGAMGLVLYNAGPAGAGFILSLAAGLRRG